MTSYHNALIFIFSLIIFVIDYFFSSKNHFQKSSRKNEKKYVQKKFLQNRFETKFLKIFENSLYSINYYFLIILDPTPYQSIIDKMLPTTNPSPALNNDLPNP
jgi:hypothetical protein